MIDIAFLRPAALWALPAIALALLVARLVRRRAYVAFSATDRIARLRHRPSALRRLPWALIFAALVFVSLALMDPVRPYSHAEVRAEGLDIVLVMDLSSSMQEIMDRPRAPLPLAQPADPARTAASARVPGRTRLDTTKDALRDFVSRRRDDRIGLVVFSDHAYLVSPLTFDYDHLLRYIDMVDDQILRGEGMTAIGDGIGLANHLLARQSPGDRPNKVIVVFTDGEHNFGRDPLETLADADRAGYRVHVVGVDLEEEVKRKPALLQLIATVRRQGGQYYHADTVRQLRAAYAAIDALETGELSSTVAVRNEPVFEWLALPAVVLVVLALALRAVPFFADFT